MKTLFLIIILLAFSPPAHATMQIPDEVYYGGEKYALHEFPLDEYIRDNNINMLSYSEGMCSANWRGYTAEWQIEDGVLYLTTLFSDACERPKPLSLKTVFPDAKGRIKADWFSGTLKLYEAGMVLLGKEPLVTLEVVKGEVEK